MVLKKAGLLHQKRLRRDRLHGTVCSELRLGPTALVRLRLAEGQKTSTRETLMRAFGFSSSSLVEDSASLHLFTDLSSASSMLAALAIGVTWIDPDVSRSPLLSS